jgi:anti-sigma factor RsiW
MDDRTTPDHFDDILDEAEALIWALLDGSLDAADTARLEGLIKQDKAVMDRYLQCVQLESELRGHFGAPPIKAPLPPQQSTPILPPLDGLPATGFGFMPPVTS